MEELRKAPWPGWETVQLIGRGSFGAVYEIRRELVDGTTESAAMKVITIPQNPEDISEMYGEGYDDESITASFRAHLKSIVAEYTLMRKLDGSANAVNCKDISYVQHPDGIGWDIYIRMELLTPLVKSLSGSTSEETVLKIGRDICSALVLCKKYDIVHRDIKPQNIFISPNGDYKLGDFGIAKTVEKTMGGTKVGTYKYMAPEVYNNQPYGSGADIYSLGLVLYWLLNERRMPFMPLPPAKVLAGQDEEARQRRLSGEPLPPPAHGSAELKKIVLKACAYAPEARFRSAEEMYEALCRCSRIPASAPTEQQSTAQPADRQQDTLAPAPLAPPPPVFEPTVIDNTSAEPEPAPAVHANDPKQRQQVPVQQGHVQKKEAAEKEPPEKKQKKPAGRGITAIITGILLLSCCVLGIYGYMHCWFGHVWQAADCTTGRVCTRCSAIAEEPLGHLWQDATCTTPKTCSRCGAAEGKALGHKWEAATCTAPKTCSRCGITNGKALGHTWEAATCTTPKTCSRCETTEGKALGHSWEAATCTAPKTCSRCGAIEGKALGHSWKAATCTTPKTCSRCKATEGKALGHSWKAATCTAPKTCSRCGATEGKALGHSWKAATCTAPKTCSRCKVTEGKALGHKWEAATYDAPKTCTVCGATTGTALKRDISAAQRRYGRNRVIAAGDTFAIGIKPDGSCIVAGNPKPNVSSWTGMCSLSACGGTVAGLRSDGTVVCSDPTLNVRDWKDIVQIDYFEGLWGEDHHIVGLTSSGKVVAAGTNRYGECNVSNWKNIVDVAAGATHTVGLRSDGTVVACGNNEYGQCNVSDWVGIVDVAASRFAVYGLTSDGHILVAGQKYEGGSVNVVSEVPTPEVSGWDNIVAILASCESGNGCDYVVGIREDGTIVTNRSTWAYLDDGDIESFQDVQCIAVASWGYTISVNSQGKVHAVGWDVDGTRIIDTWSLMKK